MMLVAVAVLYFGRDIFIPLALAILLAFVLAPLVIWLKRIGIPKIPSVVAAVLLAFLVIGGIGTIVGSQLVELAGNLPEYRRTIADKLGALRSTVAGGGIVERFTTMVRDLGRDLDRPAASPPPQAGASPPGSRLEGAGGAGRRDPVPVVIETGPAQPLTIIQTVLGPLIGPLGTTGLVIVFVIFILIEREDLRDRFIKLVGAGNLQKSTEAISEAAARVSRYLIAQLAVNVSYGIPIGLGLWWIGVPNAILWGLLATVLRFIPYLGPWLAALFPIALAFAVDPGWWMLLWVVGLFLVMELVSNNVVEPWLYGASTGLSAFAVIVGAIFWTTLWGPAGLFLATPLTVCLVVLGRYVPGLEFLGVLLGSEPVLSPEERFYQRLLAGNIVEAVEEAETAIAKSSATEFLDTVVLPALRLAESDRQLASIVELRRTFAEGIEAVMDDVAELDGVAETTHSKHGKDAAPTVPVLGTGRILCIGGRTELDEAAARLLVGRLGEAGLLAEVVPPLAVGRVTLAQLDLADVSVVLLSYLDPEPQAWARYVCRRLARRAPRAARVVALWNVGAAVLADAARSLDADAVVTTIAGAEERVTALASTERPHRRDSDSDLSEDDRRLVARLEAAGVETGRGRLAEELTRIARPLVGSGVLVVTLADAAEATGPKLEPAAAATSVLDSASARSAMSRPREAALCRSVIASGVPLVIEDVAETPTWAADPVLLEKGIRFYAGAPVVGPSGAVVAAVCILDTTPRKLDLGERADLEALGRELVRLATEMDNGAPLVSA